MNSRKIVSLLLPFFMVDALQAQLRVPRAGAVRYGDGTVRQINGLDANFAVGEQISAASDAISFSDSGGLVFKDGNIQLLSADGQVVSTYDSGEPSALLNVDGDLTTAIAWLPVRQALLHWTGKSFVFTEVHGIDSSGVVSSVRKASSNIAKLLITEAGGNVCEATVSLETGELISLDVVPGVRGPAFQQDAFTVFHDEQGLEIQSASGSMRTLPLSANDLTFERMSSDWVHVSSASTKRHWALHLNNQVLTLSELPALPTGPGSGR